MAITVILEMRAQPGRRAQLASLLETLVEHEGPGLRGFLGSTRYEALDDPDLLVEIADWESTEARATHLEESAASGAYAPVLEVLAVPVKATVVRRLP